MTENEKSRLNGPIEPLLADLNIELVDAELKRADQKRVLDIVIDKEGGVAVEDCACASRKISLVLDAEDMFAFSYTLKVGSPGIFRELKRESDFFRFLRSRVKAAYCAPDGNRRKLVGILARYQERRLTIRHGEQETTIDLDRIEKIRLFPEL